MTPEEIKKLDKLVEERVYVTISMMRERERFAPRPWINPIDPVQGRFVVRMTAIDTATGQVYSQAALQAEKSEELAIDLAKRVNMLIRDVIEKEAKK